MKKISKSIYSLLVLFGWNPVKMVKTTYSLPFYFRDLLLLFKEHQKHSNQDFLFGKLYPCLGDNFLEGGVAKGHYFHQDLLVARKIYLNNPELHVDVGSRVDGFVAHVASFRKLQVFDIRPLKSNIENIDFIEADLMGKVPDSYINYCDSLSCLHALEHFGLGRYGDPLNYDGHISGFNNLYLILRKGGKLYFSVPIGRQRIEFNAHRVFAIDYLLGLFKGRYQIDSFSYVDDKGDLHKDIELTDFSIQNNFGCNYGCGIFELTKI